MKNYFVIIISVIITVGLYGCTKEQGCINPEACNFSQSAEEDDGSCYLPGDECDDGIDTTILDQYTNTCQCEGVDPSMGCIDDTACNYSTSANTDDGSCYFIGDSCDDGNNNTLNDTWSSSCACTGELLGCTSTSACNYNSEADIDDESCYFIGDSCDDGNNNTLNDTWSSSCACTGELLGCTSTSACNYNSDADLDDGSCGFIGDSCNDGNSATINDTWSNTCDCEGIDPSTSCSTEGNGSVAITFGVYTDSWSGECQYRIHLTGDQTNATDWIFPDTDNADNSVTWYFTGYNWTMQVEDSYGDGKGPGGYYYATCLATDLVTLITLVNTPFTTGYSSSTDFIIGSGVANPSISDDN